MNPIFQSIIYQTLKSHYKKKKQGITKDISEKDIFSISVNITHLTKDIFLITCGILSAGFGLKGFLLPNSFIDGGVTGISLLIHLLSKWPLPLIIIVLNIPFIILGYFQINKAFAIKSIFSIIGLSICLAVLHYPIITTDKLLISVFGGFFLGTGIGLAVRGGAVIDGTELLAIYFSKRSSLSVGDIIWFFNIVIFSCAAYLLSVEIALYSILIYLAASKTVDFIIEGIEEYTGVTIISNYSEEIRVMIIEKMGRGVTVFIGKGGYAKYGQELKNTNILYTVITRLEISKLITEIDKIDPKAFITMSSIRDTHGGVIKKRTVKDK